MQEDTSDQASTDIYFCVKKAPYLVHVKDRIVALVGVFVDHGAESSACFLRPMLELNSRVLGDDMAWACNAGAYAKGKA